jgi:hypothetical protein
MPFVTEKTLIMAVPHTGTRWVWSALVNAGLNPKVTLVGNKKSRHATVFSSQHYLNNTRKIGAFVRNPLTWLPVWWSSNIKRKWDIQGDFGPASSLRLLLEKDQKFDEFMGLYLDSSPGAVYRFFYEYLCFTDFVGSWESITEGLIYFLKESGEEFDPDKIRKTERTFCENHETVGEYLAEGVLESESEFYEVYGKMVERVNYAKRKSVRHPT